jgi:hypothetical protein
LDLTDFTIKVLISPCIRKGRSDDHNKDKASMTKIEDGKAYLRLDLHLVGHLTLGLRASRATVAITSPSLDKVS